MSDLEYKLRQIIEQIYLEKEFMNSFLNDSTSVKTSGGVYLTDGEEEKNIIIFPEKQNKK